MADKKFSPMRYSASTEEAAVEGALQIVGASRDEIEIEVLDKSEKGVTVRIKPRSSDAPAPVAAPTESAPVEAAPVEAAPAEEEPTEIPSPIAEDVPELLAQDEANESEAPEDGSPEDEATETIAEFEAQSNADEVESADVAPADVAEDADTEGDEEAPAIEAVTEAPQLVEQDPEVVERARVQAQEFLDRMGLEATAGPGPSTDAGSVALVIEGDDVGILIGKHGSTLQAFQYLLNLTLNAHHEGEGTRVVVDAGNYRARRQSSLEQTARSAASKARRENRAIRLEPMPAHERRLVHLFLQTEADIATQSEGREPMRRIVVSPASGGRPAAPSRSGRSNNGGMGGYRRGDANSERNRGYRGR